MHDCTRTHPRKQPHRKIMTTWEIAGLICAHTHTLTKKKEKTQQIIFNLLLVPAALPPSLPPSSLHPFPHVLLTFGPLSRALPFSHSPSLLPVFHGFRYQAQLHWLAGAFWHNILSKVTLPLCASVCPFLPSMLFALSSSDSPLFVTVCWFFDPDQSFG